MKELKELLLRLKTFTDSSSVFIVSLINSYLEKETNVRNKDFVMSISSFRKHVLIRMIEWYIDELDVITMADILESSRAVSFEYKDVTYTLYKVYGKPVFIQPGQLDSTDLTYELTDTVRRLF